MMESRVINTAFLSSMSTVNLVSKESHVMKTKRLDKVNVVRFPILY